MKIDERWNYSVIQAEDPEEWQIMLTIVPVFAKREKISYQICDVGYYLYLFPLHQTCSELSASWILFFSCKKNLKTLEASVNEC